MGQNKICQTDEQQRDTRPDGTQRVIVGVSGASGIPIAYRALELLRGIEACKTHLVVSPAARTTAALEWDRPLSTLEELADVVYDPSDMGAAIASGTFACVGMVVVPCSMRTAACIASGVSDNLLLRAADVTIKERRPLVLAVRESPLSPIHLGNLQRLSTLQNVFICPPTLSYYHGAKTLEQMETHIAQSLIRHVGIEIPGAFEWRG